MKEYKFKSTNGRWGVNVLSSVKVVQGVPIQGTLTDLGDMTGFSNFKITPRKDGPWVIVLGDIEPVEGTGIKVVKSLSLQSRRYVNVVVATPGATWKKYGVARRSSWYRSLNHEGKIENAPTSMLIEMGVVKPKTQPKQIEEPEPANSAMLHAMGKAGLIK